MDLIPRNWSEFQHYKDRCPPWIKLHKELLNDRSFITLPLASKALAPLMWLLASEHKDGIFDASLDELEFRLRMSHDELVQGLKPLLDKGFFVDPETLQKVDASSMLADCKQPATPEERRGEQRKKESESETKKEEADSKSKRFKKPGVEDVKSYMIEYGNEKQIFVDLFNEPQKFFDYYESKGWKVGTSAMKDWKAAARNWMGRINNNIGGSNATHQPTDNSALGRVKALNAQRERERQAEAEWQNHGQPMGEDDRVVWTQMD